MLGRIAFSLPHGDTRPVIEALLALPQPIRSKRELFAAMILDGEVLSADLVLSAMAAWTDDAGQNTWRRRELWEPIGWLELLPFTDRPDSLLDGVAMLADAVPHLDRMDRVVTAAANAPGGQAEILLVALLRRFPTLVSQHEWAQALLRIRSVSAAVALVDLVVNETLGAGRGAVEIWRAARELAALAKKQPELQAEVLRRYEQGEHGGRHRLLERILAEVGNADCAAALARGYAREGKGFDGTLHEALRKAAVDERPVEGQPGVLNLHPVPMTEMRRELFALLGGAPRQAALAAQCLIAIDRLRDYFGPVEFEPRHPDISSGRAWPLAAQGLLEASVGAEAAPPVATRGA
jgi:hypothetical protein